MGPSFAVFAIAFSRFIAAARPAAWSRQLSRGELVLAALAREDRPQAPDAVVGPERPAVRRLAVPVVGEAVPEPPLQGVDAEPAIDHRKRRQHREVIGAENAEPDELQEARVHD